MGISCIATLQIGVSASLSPADAILDIERFGSPVHIESPENADCAVDHGHFFCQVVRSLSKAGVSEGITLSQVGEPPSDYPRRTETLTESPSRGSWSVRSFPGLRPPLDAPRGARAPLLPSFHGLVTLSRVARIREPCVQSESAIH